MGQKEVQLAIEAAIREAYQRKHEYVTTEHLLYAFLFEPEAQQILLHCGAKLSTLQNEIDTHLNENIPIQKEENLQHPKQTVGFKRVLEQALLHMHSAGKEILSSGDILAAILLEEEAYATHILAKQGITRLDVLEYISHGVSKVQPSGIPHEGPEQEFDNTQITNPLEAFTRNITQQALDGQLDPLIGRSNEMHRIMQILCRRRKNNPVLVGDAGVGKTAIIEGLAQIIVANDVPAPLQDSEIYALDLGSLLAGTKFRGQFEERMKAVLNKLEEIPKPILLIDEIHMIVGAGAASGSSMDVSNLLKPVLQAGHVKCVGATTYEDFKRSLEKDTALMRRFQKIELKESSVEETIEILQGLKFHYEEFHEITYSDDALQSAAQLADRYVKERYLPDKAIDVIDEAGARNRLQDDHERLTHIDKQQIEEVVSNIANIPTLNAQASERERLSILEKELKKIVFGQDSAIEAVVNAVKLSRAGLGHPEQPMGAFLFTGPTGVGKTEVAKQLAHNLGIGFERFDMSEYMEKHTVSRLVGAPPGYVGFDQGGLLTEAIRKNSHCVLLLDEIEKAHPDLFDILLQVMDNASLTDNNGRKADFHNVIIIMTSNAGSREMSEKAIGFGQSTDISRGKKAIEKLFSPEFRNRLSDIVTFNKLSMHVMTLIVEKFIQQLQHQLSSKHVELDVSQAAREYFTHKGYDEIYGARPLDRLLKKAIRQPLAELMLFSDLEHGGTVHVDCVDDEIVLQPST